MKKFINLFIILLVIFLFTNNSFSTLTEKYEFVENKYKERVKRDLFIYFEKEKISKYNIDSVEFKFIPQSRIYKLDSTLLTYDTKFYDIDTNLNNLEIGLFYNKGLIGWISYKNFYDQFENTDYQPTIEVLKDKIEPIFKSSVFHYFYNSSDNEKLRYKKIFYDFYDGYLILFEITDSCVNLNKKANKIEKFSYFYQICNSEELSSLIIDQNYYIFNNYFSKLIYKEGTSNELNNENLKYNFTSFESYYNRILDSIKSYQLKYLNAHWDTIIKTKDLLYQEMIKANQHKKEYSAYSKLLKNFKKEILDSLELIVIPRFNLSINSYNFKKSFFENLIYNSKIYRYLIIAKYKDKIIFNLSEENSKDILNQIYLIDGAFVEYNINHDFNLELFKKDYPFHINNFFIFKENDTYKISWRNSLNKFDINRLKVNFKIEDFIYKYFNHLFLLYYLQN